MKLYYIKIILHSVDEEMTRWFKALVAPIEDPGSVSSAHMVAHNHNHFSFRSRLLVSTGTRHTDVAHTYMPSLKHAYNTK